jgi:SNF2 family DNA or RNA helicase
MKEFFACCDFVNPGIFGNYKQFKQVFEGPIEKAMEEGCDKEQKELGLERSKELS